MVLITAGDNYTAVIDQNGPDHCRRQFYCTSQVGQEAGGEEEADDSKHEEQ